MKQPIKKKDFKKPSIDSIKEKMNLTVKSSADLVKSAADKPIDFIPLPQAFADAIKLPGIPKGYLSIVTGWSNTGKSTIKNCLIASCINNGIIPVIYETENNFDFQYAIDCGMKATPVYGDVEVEHIDTETGEITYTTENRIIDYKGDFFYFDNKILAEAYGDNDYATGKKLKVKRKQAVLEDIAFSINTFLDAQDDGTIQQPLCFIWDSIGSIQSLRSYESKSGNNMFDAGAISQAFNNIINDRIPSSKKVSEPYTNTFFCVNKIWNDSMNSMGGVPSIELKGGKTMFYGARLIIHLGGMGKSATKKLTATAKGETYNYGITTKVRTTKNQLPTPWNITYEGEMSCVHNGLINPDKLDEYKKTYVKNILAKLEETSGKKLDITENDVQFAEEESDE
jgi:hypothetical protein